MINFKDIKLVIIDVDGTLTDGMYNVHSDGIIHKSFYTRDFENIGKLLKSGIDVLIITQASDNVLSKQVGRLLRVSDTWKNAYEDCRFSYIYGSQNKVESIENYMQNTIPDITWNNIVHIGDSFNDLDAMKKAGLTGCPNDAIDEIKEQSNFISDYNGGKGAVGQIINYILTKRGC